MKQETIKLIKKERGSSEMAQMPNSKEIAEIKLSYPRLAKQYIIFFNQFRRIFSNSENKEIEKLMEEHSSHAINLLNKFAVLEREHEFGKSEARFQIEDYVGKYYFDISDFLDVCMEVFGDE